MKRTDRLRRIGDILETQERSARQAMAQANDELRRASEAVEVVLEQCGRVHPPGDKSSQSSDPTLSAAASAAIVESGLREASDRAAVRDDAWEAAEERRRVWQRVNSQYEAVGRLAERRTEEAEVEMRKRSGDELEDVINARGSRTRHPNPDGEDRR